MNDPKPTRIIAIIGMVALLMVQLWWLSISQTERNFRLLQVARAEGAITPPPQTIIAQYNWLTEHRLNNLHGMIMVVTFGMVIGIIEGVLRRRQDPNGGYLLGFWTVGLLFIVALFLGVSHYLIMPFPMPSLLVMVVFVVLGELGAYGLCAGRPQIT